eukprot:gnl/TRDRNA2_/TRDRNA2_87062_c0_seq1.p1 gnl/TRDRNA2_/TRDRNA2_87062_c0~~gnl/TRDRNA2_/TRDRNA2_87062_c0_seq1.p1  ORF type:complete len:756 (+),score=84.66 gnl/TRDRNA2_/TRDRNA2_87062_c0_seq1:50-2269(+)
MTAGRMAVDSAALGTSDILTGIVGFGRLNVGRSAAGLRTSMSIVLRRAAVQRLVRVLQCLMMEQIRLGYARWRRGAQLKDWSERRAFVLDRTQSGQAALTKQQENEIAELRQNWRAARDTLLNSVAQPSGGVVPLPDAQRLRRLDKKFRLKLEDLQKGHHDTREYFDSTCRKLRVECETNLRALSLSSLGLSNPAPCRDVAWCVEDVDADALHALQWGFSQRPDSLTLSLPHAVSLGEQHKQLSSVSGRLLEYMDTLRGWTRHAIEEPGRAHVRPRSHALAAKLMKSVLMRCQHRTARAVLLELAEMVRRDRLSRGSSAAVIAARQLQKFASERQLPSQQEQMLQPQVLAAGHSRQARLDHQTIGRLGSDFYHSSLEAAPSYSRLQPSKGVTPETSAKSSPYGHNGRTRGSSPGTPAGTFAERSISASLHEVHGPSEPQAGASAYWSTFVLGDSERASLGAAQSAGSAPARASTARSPSRASLKYSLMSPRPEVPASPRSSSSPHNGSSPMRRSPVPRVAMERVSNAVPSTSSSSRTSLPFSGASSARAKPTTPVAGAGNAASQRTLANHHHPLQDHGQQVKLMSSHAAHGTDKRPSSQESVLQHRGSGRVSAGSLVSAHSQEGQGNPHTPETANGGRQPDADPHTPGSTALSAEAPHVGQVRSLPGRQNSVGESPASAEDLSVSSSQASSDEDDDEEEESESEDSTESSEEANTPLRHDTHSSTGNAPVKQLVSSDRE